jgi:IS30 family transposase
MGYIIPFMRRKLQKAESKTPTKKYLLKTRSTLKSYVLEKLRLGWSPEQIAGRLKKEIRKGSRSAKEYINHESIY